jgi:hypothetical protein
MERGIRHAHCDAVSQNHRQREGCKSRTELRRKEPKAQKRKEQQVHQNPGEHPEAQPLGRTTLARKQFMGAAEQEAEDGRPAQEGQKPG